jgi:hypothetical protein
VDGLSTLDQDHPAASSASALEYQKEFVMKPYRAFLFGMLVMLLASSLFWAATAYARTGCFPDTNGHWAEQFICWLKDSGISTGYPDGTFRPENTVTRGELAVMLQRASNIPPVTGSVILMSGANNWDYMGVQTALLETDRAGSYTGFASLSPDTTHTFVLTPDVLSVLYDRRLGVGGIGICFNASHDAYIDSVKIMDGSEVWVDDTDLDYSGCQWIDYYHQMIRDNLQIYVVGRWGTQAAGAEIRLGSVYIALHVTEIILD